jgi:hypothetical protein
MQLKQKAGPAMAPLFRIPHCRVAAARRRRAAI